MSNNIVKIPADTAGPFTQARNKISFTIPEGLMCDLSKSYIAINTDISTTDTAGTKSVYNVCTTIADDVDNDVYQNVALVKHASMDASQVGMIESLRDVNLRAVTHNQYTQDENDKIEDRVMATNQTHEYNDFPVSPYRVLKSEGDLAVIGSSEEISHELKIPLKDIYGIAYNKVYDTSKYGQTKMKMEFNFGKLSAEQHGDQGDVIWLKDAAFKGSMLKLTNGTANAQTVGRATDDRQLSTLIAYDSVEESPFYLGQKLEVRFRIGVSGGVGTLQAAIPNCIIQRIDHNDGTNGTVAGTLTLFFDTQLVAALPAGSAVFTCDAAADGQPTFRGTDAGSVNQSINSLDLVLNTYPNPSAVQVPDKLSYFTYFSEQDNANGNNPHRKNYTIPAEAVSVMVAFPAANDSINSKLAYSSYRIMYDNEFEVDRDVEKDKQLNYYMTSRYFADHERPLKSLLEKRRNGLAADSANIAVANNAIFSVSPQTPMSKQMNLEINGVAVNRLHIYSKVPRTI
jgi:hypothetical protein